MLVARVFGFYSGIFWCLVYVAECGSGPPNGGSLDTCSSYNGKYNGLNHAFATYFGSFEHQNGVPITQQEDIFCNSESSHLTSWFFDVNPSGQTGQHHVDHGISCASANNVDHIVHSPHQKEISFVSMNSNIGESRFSSDSSSPRVRISPYKLDWGQRYLYHPSIAHLSLQNTCNESVLKVYESFTTNRQFYPLNISEIVLLPGEATTVPFIFSPKWLGLSLSEVILQTSFGGFVIEARGLAIESPYNLRPLLGSGVSYGGWLSKKLPLFNPFNESIHLKEVTARFAVFESSKILLSESYRTKQDHLEVNKHTSDSRTLSIVRSMKFGSVDMEIRVVSNWIIDPYKTESILELAFLPGSKGHVLGSICVELVRPRLGEKDTLLIPFEAELNRTTTSKNNGLLSFNVESIGGCDGNETTLSVSVRNNALHLMKVIKVGEVSDMKTPLKIKIEYTEGLLLFPGSLTHVALVTYESRQVKYEIDDLKMACMLQISTNDTVAPILEIPCWEMFVVCSKHRQKMLLHRLDDVDLSNEMRESSTISRNSPFSIRAFGETEVDKFILQSWQSQSTKDGLYVLNDHDLFFPTVLLGNYYAKSITVKNPSQQPIIVQLILNSRETVDNCSRTNNDNLLSPSPNNNILHNSVGPTKYGFSLIDDAIIEAYLQPYESTILGPIFFRPSNRCDWRSAALIRNNVSGVELLSLYGKGVSFSLGLYEGLEYVHQLNFNTNLLFPPNIFSPHISPINRDPSFGCRKPLLKKLVAVNSGDFTVTVHGIHVSGTECGSNGFTVHNCKAFVLKPGESVEFGISYQSDFSAHVISRNLELMLGAEMLVIPMKASVPLYILNICRESIFWMRVKNCCVGGLFGCILMSLLFWILMPYVGPTSSSDYLIEDERRCKNVERAKGKSSSLNFNKGNNKPFSSTKKGSPKSAQKDEPRAISILTYTKCENVVQCESDNALSSDAPVLKDVGGSLAESAESFGAVQPVSLTVRTRKDKKRKPKKRRGGGSGLTSLVEVSSSQSGNSTPSSPLSPFTTTSPNEKKYSPSIQNRQPRDSPSLSGVIDVDSKSQSCASEESLLCTQLQASRPSKKGNKPMLLQSATFPGMGTRSSPSRFTVSQDDRAPGPKIKKAVELEGRTSSDESLTYDIWGDHFSRLHLIARPNKVNDVTSEDVEGNPDSFFLRGPRQTLLTNSRLKSVCTTSSYEQG